MNIPVPQAEKKSQFFSYILAACAVLTLLTLSSNLIRKVELRLPAPSTDTAHVQTEKANVPVAIPVPIPRGERAQLLVTPQEVENTRPFLVPQISPIPAPSVPY